MLVAVHCKGLKDHTVNIQGCIPYTGQACQPRAGCHQVTTIHTHLMSLIPEPGAAETHMVRAVDFTCVCCVQRYSPRHKISSPSYTHMATSPSHGIGLGHATGSLQHHFAMGATKGKGRHGLPWVSHPRGMGGGLGVGHLVCRGSIPHHGYHLRSSQLARSFLTHISTCLTWCPSLKPE